MGTKERKARDLRQRESLILEAARDMILAEGYLGLSMDRLADAVEYSKPTLYSHFATKEDLILAVANASHRQRVEMFLRASAHRAPTRHRLAAVGVADELFVFRHREHFQLEQLLRAPSLWEKISPERRAQHAADANACVGVIAGLVGQAILAGELPQRPGLAEDVADGLRSISLGTHLIAAAHPQNDEELGAIYLRLRRNQAAFVDGVGWQPLTKDIDAPAMYRRIYAEVFPLEAGSLPTALHY